ncbi:MAG: Uma2 family endonuclease [Cyanobacteria bacterium P01_H01_bin.58]
MVGTVTGMVQMVQAIQKSVTRVCWTRDRYIAAYHAGLLPEQTELIAGDIVEVPIPDPIHEAAIRALMQVLLKAFIAESTVVCEKSTPIALSPIDQPVTDFVVMRQDLELYRNDHPQPDDIYLAVEVANSHPERDRKIKLPQYAAGNVQEYWVVDLQRRELWVCRHPNNSDYTFQQGWQDERISLLRLPQIAINLKPFYDWLML